MDFSCFGMKSIKNLIVGIATFAVLSTSLYAFGGIKEDVSYLKKILPKITLAHEVCYKKLEGKDYFYKINTLASNEFEFEAHSKETGNIYEFRDLGANGTLDVYISSRGFEFTPKNTPAEKWKKLEEKFYTYIGEMLPLAKKVLNKRSSNLDTDLEEM